MTPLRKPDDNLTPVERVRVADEIVAKLADQIAKAVRQRKQANARPGAS